MSSEVMVLIKFTVRITVTGRIDGLMLVQMQDQKDPMLHTLQVTLPRDDLHLWRI